MISGKIMNLCTRTILLLTCLTCAGLLNAEPRWEAAIQKFEAKDQVTSPPKNGILFVGSSSIVGWNVEKFFPGMPVINRGFGGSQISDVIQYFDRVVTPYQPDTIVFYSGDNDISAKKTTATVINDMEKFVAMVHEELPSAKILLIPPKASIARWHLWPKMQEVDKAEQEIAESDNLVVHIDTNKQMIGADGKPRAELLKKDGLHMTEAGYVIWSDLVGPHLEADTSGSESGGTTVTAP